MHESSDWRPSVSITHLKKRAHMLAEIRQFFAARNILEVETPQLYTVPASDPHLHSLHSDIHHPGGELANTLYLHTSPEFAMKRLLAAGSGSIYQLCKVFRDQEQGHHHHIEFTLLEWYRVGWDEQQLMAEVDELLQTILQTKPAQYYTYQYLFEQACQLNPHQAPLHALQACAQQHNLRIVGNQQDRDTWCQLLMTHVVEPTLQDETAPVIIQDFPASQAALARLKANDSSIACRFEVYVKGIELANGFYELCDAQEQLQRFDNDNKQRQQLGYPVVPIDHQLIAALKHGLPDCAGVALGIDRLLMLALGENDIAKVAWG